MLRAVCRPGLLRKYAKAESNNEAFCRLVLRGTCTTKDAIFGGCSGSEEITPGEGGELNNEAACFRGRVLTAGQKKRSGFAVAEKRVERATGFC